MAITLYRQVGKGKAWRNQKVWKVSDLLPTTGLPRRLGRRSQDRSNNPESCRSDSSRDTVRSAPRLPGENWQSRTASLACGRPGRLLAPR